MIVPLIDVPIFIYNRCFSYEQQTVRQTHLIE